MADQPHWYDPQLGATNLSQRWQAAYSLPRFGNWATSVVASYAEDEPVAALATSCQVSQASVFYAEAAAARRDAMLDKSVDANRLWRPQAAVGASFTSEWNVTLTLEGDWNGFGIWGKSDAFPLAVQEGFLQQEPAGRLDVMLLCQWSRFVFRYSDLTVVVRSNPTDLSWFAWSEWRHNWQRWSLAVSGGMRQGSERTEYGAPPVGASAMALVRVYI
jgi:hypothetical protein